MNYVLSSIMNLKIISMIFIFIWRVLSSRRRMMILVKPRSWTFLIDAHDRKLTLSCLIKRRVCPLNINCMHYWDSYIPIFCALIGYEILHVARAMRSLIRMVGLADLLSMWMEKQSSECILHYWKWSLRNTLRYFSFPNAADEYVKLLFW